MSEDLLKKTFSPELLKAPFLGHHVHPSICTLGQSHLLSLVRFDGVSHETRDPTLLNQEFQLLNRCLQALGRQEGNHLLVKTYCYKTRICHDTAYHLELPILQDFVDKYVEPFKKGEFRQVGYAMVLMLKYQDLEEGIARMGDLLSICKEMLATFGIKIMGMEENDGKLYSQIGQFFSFILNGTAHPVPITDSRLGDLIIDSETAFGAYDYVENRPYRGKTRFASTFDLRDYPEATTPGMWDEALEEQSDFILTQSFHFEDRNQIKRKLKVQTSDLSATEGQSEQTDALQDAVQAVTQGRVVFGQYHASLIVFGQTADDAVNNGAKMQSIMMAKNTGFVRSTSTNIFTWLTLFPGYNDVIYAMPKSTENLSCGFSLHATPIGKEKGNPPGDGTALMPIKTNKGGIYFLNAHDSPPWENSTGKSLPGHIVNHAMTGAGKSSSAAIKLIFFSRWNPMIFAIDYNHSMENVHRALGGKYFAIKPGEFTGINPFQLTDTVNLRQYLFDTVKQCAGGATPEEEHVIQLAIDAVMKHTQVENRSFSLLLQFINETGGNGLRARLAKWCRNAGGKKGHYAWVLDSPKNTFDPTCFRRLAFDCSGLLKKEYVERHPEVVEVMLNTFFYLKERMHATAPGSLLINQISEYWVSLAFKSTAAKIEEILLAGRMRGEILMMDTQTPEHALKTEMAATIVQQVITQEWMANTKANRESYAKFGVTGREFEKITELNEYSRKVMIKQGSATVIGSLMLGAELEYWLPLLSATERNLQIAEQVRQKLQTEDPAVWVSAFLDEMVAVDVRQKLQTDDRDIWYPEFLHVLKKLGRKETDTLFRGKPICEVN